MTSSATSSSGSLLFPAATVGTAVLAGALGALEPIAGLAVAGVLAVVVLVTAPPVVTLAVALLAYLLPLTHLAAVVGADTRAAVPLLTLVVLARTVGQRWRVEVTRCVAGVAALGVTAVTSTLWSAVPAESLAAGVALVVSAVLLLLARSLVTPAQLTALLARSSAVVIALSAVALATPLGELGGRARGIFANPNSLSLFVVLVLPILVSDRRTRLLAVPALGLVLASGSRAGAIACVLEILVLVAAARGRGGRALVVLLLVGSAVAGGIAMSTSLAAMPAGFSPATARVAAESADAASLMRTTDSRSLHWLLAYETWREKPLGGMGAGAAGIDPANSYLKLLADLGLLGVAAALPLLGLLRRVFWRGPPVPAALVIGAVVNAVFESWLLTAGSFFFLLFWLQLAHVDVAPAAPEPARPRARRVTTAGPASAPAPAAAARRPARTSRPAGG